MRPKTISCAKLMRLLLSLLVLKKSHLYIIPSLLSAYVKYQLTTIFGQCPLLMEVTIPQQVVSNQQYLIQIKLPPIFNYRYRRSNEKRQERQHPPISTLPSQLCLLITSTRLSQCSTDLQLIPRSVTLPKERPKSVRLT